MRDYEGEFGFVKEGFGPRKFKELIESEIEQDFELRLRKQDALSRRASCDFRFGLAAVQSQISDLRLAR